jgi:thioredoxin reductase (NADPH)
MEIIGDKRVNKIRVLVEESGESVKERLIETDGVFIEIGATPFTDVVKPLGVRLDCDGFIETDRAMKTSVEGVFAAGDNTNNFLKQMITAAGEGAIAAKSAYEFLRHK